MKVLLIAVHGRDGSPESNSISTINKFFTDSCDIITPHYDAYDDHDITAKYFDSFIKDYSDYDTVVCIGMSLGGYWAKYLANRIKGAKYIGLNPSFEYYGFEAEADLIDLPITIYVALDDDVVDPNYVIHRYKNRATINKFNSGGHRLLDKFDIICKSIAKDINILNN